MEIFDAKNAPFLLTTEAFEIYSQCMYQPTFDEYKNELSELASKPEISIFACSYQQENAGIIVLSARPGDSAEILGIAVTLHSDAAICLRDFRAGVSRSAGNKCKILCVIGKFKIIGVVACYGILITGNLHSHRCTVSGAERFPVRIRSKAYIILPFCGSDRHWNC